MTDPFDELAAELGVETIKPPAPEPPPLPETGPESEPAPTDLAQQLFTGDSELDPADASVHQEIIELGGTEEQKKRRRRRRRRRKGEPGEGGEEPAAEPESFSQPSELLREIIKNWDVPSWDEIVAGLYRPNR